MNKLLLQILGLMAFITLVGIITQRSQRKTTPPSRTQATKQIQIGNKKIFVEVAKTQQERKNGLSGRELLEKDSGMLFVFEEQNIKPLFWMKGMKFAIDIIWIDNNKVVKIDKNVQPPDQNTPDEKLPLYGPGQPIDFVLEVPAGFAVENDIKIGDSVDLLNSLD